MPKGRAVYAEVLRTLGDWEPYLRAESGLPGPRANLELAHSVAQEAPGPLLLRYARLGPEEAPANTPAEFLAFCGVLGLGRLADEGRRELLSELQRLASDPRWRIREAVATALQLLGDSDKDALWRAVAPWGAGNPFEQRAAVAALCEPRLLADHSLALRTLDLLDQVTASFAAASPSERRAEGGTVLRKGLAYCWSVACVGAPDQGKKLMERWLTSPDPELRRIMRENLKKDRLRRLDPAWTEHWLVVLGGSDA